ncbi:bifunctional 1-(5-phosphoribosyl)-5-((5-phosphoribosylamino)methylideneamino)imidazole-4-carboxamide isomerase/phosphoribosylanthranilate isomerase PriA [Corynebacterium aquatimens]|uniref:1-(5-phosphoribosyl)-5-[(5-phosphoribosylamino)methylideneamino] imidazole-4-carboxamide isomerase n=1 Tax=Corynebacterium aquatimens TaxID=1190508 RepID=A0A931GTK7_9CORY|nr:bifunctional 1-(5-phosphoribosyl)-5-((5-phosphoribosylamino)methylideneamino)imidazole-4-carboxamide isomerase/phosphoribosylanthranilate isomerase PriA [Corynebacterium aquatimens]MBG6121920.1 1-(5-phosphoribosyl)-5-[(5-phosphoribosylamino)methylideneamino] imidazole-4-carboxamide isomerase/N-(5'phosphoribosyl)anthranilate isomerase [Corynebacterium aquatimens]WJY65542.1 1-(5-phosphoribosyl)-5-[(5-phosphoribosylamino)methylideneamino] imidazole-4-carboxamide isomerase [Corynebacterium aquatim
MSFTLLPAVDVVDGHAVRLDQGEAGTEKHYGSPLDAALQWQEQGAQWLHFVDLDAAFGRGSNHELMAEITRTLDINVELTGGIRDDETLERALATGAKRVNIGTAALNNPEWAIDAIHRHGDAIAVDIAVREENGEWRTKGKGWTEDGGDLWEVLERFDAAGCTRFVVTDVSKDGTLAGPNIDLLRDVAAATDAAITASGGVSTLDDIKTIASYAHEGIDSVIIGKALYEKRFTLNDALVLAQQAPTEGESGASGPQAPTEGGGTA